MNRRAGAWLWGAIALAACGHKEPAARPAVVAQAPATPAPDAAAVLAPELDEAAARKLADAYHDIRCVLVGAALAPPDLYRRHGYDDGPAFAAAFDAQATRRPDWARKAVGDSLARPCAAAGAAAAPTPTATP